MGFRNEKKSKIQTQTIDSIQTNGDKEVNVLYQKLGDSWYSFALVGDEVFMGKIPDEAIEQIRKMEQDSLES